MGDDKLVGIVLVSHSAEVAASVAALAKELAGG
ncbi:PTS fructose transporter subunit IIA, partial [Streptomyces spiralis]